MDQAESRARATASRMMALNAASRASRVVHEELARRYDALAGNEKMIVASQQLDFNVGIKDAEGGTSKGADHRNVRTRLGISVGKGSTDRIAPIVSGIRETISVGE
ncbi:hypothetical protein [Polymorphobacter megasporae]|uniref:hypothetical protein n=1 Tax=Glacieibacterium megasporae TaxID=2835787 RepID=UPI001C1E7F64|nr:hypothetical protein [Polymorphobacter megasporae]UAJ12559.1 hypothetical protein KTC28_18525 [Polymorphobacter megasporae]